MISKDEAQETWKTMGCGTSQIQPNIFPTPPIHKPVPSFELYESDLRNLANLLGYVEDVANNEGVFDVQIRVRFDDTEYWAVLGYGEAGDPAIIRFER